MVVVPVMLNTIGLGAGAEILALLRWPALLALAALGLSAVYRFGPSRDKPKWRWVTPGSAAAAVLWMAASALFSWYLTNFGHYNETYGSLGAVFGFMMWLWLSGVVILLGAELNWQVLVLGDPRGVRSPELRPFRCPARCPEKNSEHAAENRLT